MISLYLKKAFLNFVIVFYKYYKNFDLKFRAYP